MQSSLILYTHALDLSEHGIDFPSFYQFIIIIQIYPFLIFQLKVVVGRSGLNVEAWLHIVPLVATAFKHSAASIVLGVPMTHAKAVSLDWNKLRNKVSHIVNDIPYYLFILHNMSCRCSM